MPPQLPVPIPKPVRSLWQEFKAFAFKGNMIDLAVGVVIGAAFTSLIGSLVKNVIMPIINYVAPSTKFADWHIGKVQIGALMVDLLTFILTALVVFIFIVKLLGAVRKRVSPPSPSEPLLKECPLCLSEIPAKARKCSHCTADLPQGDAPAAGAWPDDELKTRSPNA